MFEQYKYGLIYICFTFSISLFKPPQNVSLVVRHKEFSSARLTLKLSSLGLGKVSGEDNKILISATSFSIHLTSVSTASTS